MESRQYIGKDLRNHSIIQRKITIHFDNERPRTDRNVVEYMHLHNMKRASNLAYSLDVDESDFCLLGYLIERMKLLKIFINIININKIIL